MYSFTKPKEELHVFKYMLLSTSHLPPDCSDWMGKFASLEDEFGWFVNVDVLEWADPEDHHSELSNVLMFAAKQKCEYVWFDADADEHPDLPTWEW